MKMKSLLLGSAVAMAAATGAARAADTVVFAPEPEPMEYVRICDVYGAGFFYIPGTETCLKIGGQFRYEIRGADTDGDGAADDGYTKFARFQLNTDVRSETSMGTLRGYAEIRTEWNNGAPTSYINQSFIELQQSMGTWRIGISDTPYARFLGYGSGGVYGAVYGFRNSGELSYTFTGSNGFSAVIAAIDDQNANWTPDVEGGVNFKQGWGSIGAIAGYDESASEWGAKAVARFNISPMFSAGLHAFYSSNRGAAAGSYQIMAPVSGLTSEWSVLAHAQVQFSPTIAAKAHVQWFDSPAAGLNDEWQIAGGLILTPVKNLEIRPEMVYSTGNGDKWAWTIRFDRNF